MPLDDQIRAAAADGATADEIAAQLNCETAAVKNALNATEDFTEDDTRQLANVIKEIAFNGENERNRLTAAMFVYEVKRGLKVPKRDTPTITAVQINQLIHASNQDIARLAGAYQQSPQNTLAADSGTQPREIEESPEFRENTDNSPTIQEPGLARAAADNPNN